MKNTHVWWYPAPVRKERVLVHAVPYGMMYHIVSYVWYLHHTSKYHIRSTSYVTAVHKYRHFPRDIHASTYICHIVSYISCTHPAGTGRSIDRSFLETRECMKWTVCALGMMYLIVSPGGEDRVLVCSIINMILRSLYACVSFPWNKRKNHSDLDILAPPLCPAAIIRARTPSSISQCS